MSQSLVRRTAPAILRGFPRRWLDGLRSSWTGPLSLKSPELARIFSDGQKSYAGVPVTYASAFTFSAVYDAVNQISSDIAKLPFNLMKRRADGGAEPFWDSKLYRLMKVEPNPEMGSMVFRRTLQAHALTLKGAFAEIERDGLGKPAALWPLDPTRVTPKRDSRDRLYYEVQNYDGKPATALDPRDVLHIAGLGYDGLSGYSVIDKARQAIGLALAAERFGATFFGNGSTFGGVLSTDQPMPGEEDQKAFREMIESLHMGPERAHRFLMLWGGVKYQRTGIAPNEAQMNELRSKQVEEVARFFNMPPHKLKNLERATFSNIEQQDLEYYKGPILSWITLWEEECNRKLIPSLEARQQFFKHNANAFLRADAAGRTALYSALLDRGVYSADEVRELEDMNPQPDGQGAMYLVQGAMVPKDRVQALADAQIKRSETPAPTPPDSADSDPRVRDMAERVERAEAAAVEARERAAVEAARRADVEASAGVLACERDEALERERLSAIQAASLTAVADGLRSELTALTDRLAAEGEARTLVESERQALRASLDAARAAQPALEAAVEDARVALAEAERRAADAEQVASVATVERAASDAARDEARRAATEAADRLREALEAVAAAEAARAGAIEKAERALADVADAEAERASLELERQAAAAASEAARSEAVRLEALLHDESSARRAVEAKLAASEQERAELASALDVSTRSADTSDAAIIAAHRALAEHRLRGLIARQRDRLLRDKPTPERLRTIAEKWYEGFTAAMTDELLPIVTVHLAFIRSSESARAMTDGIVSAHVRESIGQILALADGEPGAIGIALARVLDRWDAERPAAFAEALMQKELDYVRSRAA